MMNSEHAATVQTILAAHEGMPGALLPILHAVQAALGYVPEDTLPTIAQALNLSRAEVYGVVTYYHHFRQTPPPTHIVQICRAEACQTRGAEHLFAHAEARLGCAAHETSRDGHVLLEAVYCLGQCAVGPALLIDEHALHARVDDAAFDALIDHLEVAR